MPRFLYLTADDVGAPTGGGAVTRHESEALKELGDTLVVGRRELLPHLAEGEGDPWRWDLAACRLLHSLGEKFHLAHLYSGTFTMAVNYLKRCGTLVCYTCAAHNVADSWREYEELIGAFPYPHLTDPDLWCEYVQGYRDSDVLVVPSDYSKVVMREYGCRNRAVVIPHGCHLPERVSSLPPRFTAGYLGAFGPDKGVRYLLEAWRLADLPGARLVLGGSQSTTPWANELVRRFGGGEISMLGWVDDVSDFYDQISVYVQPSVTEGFGIEVVEAMAHGRPVLASCGVGASQWLRGTHTFAPRDVNRLAGLLKAGYETFTRCPDEYAEDCQFERSHVSKFGLTWPAVREKYKELWRSLL